MGMLQLGEWSGAKALLDKIASDSGLGKEDGVRAILDHPEVSRALIALLHKEIEPVYSRLSPTRTLGCGPAGLRTDGASAKPPTLTEIRLLAQNASKLAASLRTRRWAPPRRAWSNGYSP